MTIMETLTYQHQQPKNWLYEIKQKGDSQTCYVMVQNAKVCTNFNLHELNLFALTQLRVFYFIY